MYRGVVAKSLRFLTKTFWKTSLVCPQWRYGPGMGRYPLGWEGGRFFLVLLILGPRLYTIFKKVYQNYCHEIESMSFPKVKTRDGKLARSIQWKINSFVHVRKIVFLPVFQEWNNCPFSHLWSLRPSILLAPSLKLSLVGSCPLPPCHCMSQSDLKWSQKCSADNTCYFFNFNYMPANDRVARLLNTCSQGWRFELRSSPVTKV